MRKTFVAGLIERAKTDDRIFVITPDLGFSVLEEFMTLYPDRLLNVGIAEQNAIGVAAGLALTGKVVYVYSIIPFVTMRCFEQIRVDVAYMNTNIRIVGVGAGFSYGPAGATHHAVEDIAIMRALPNMTVCCPGDPVEVRKIVNQSFDYPGPMYIRLGKSGEPAIHKQDAPVVIGKAIEVIHGKDLALIATSNMLETGKNMVEAWEKEGMQASLISMPTIKPIDKDFLVQLIKSNRPIVTLEEHSIIGGLGSAVAEIIAESGCAVPFKRLGIPDEFSHYVGSHAFIRNKYGLGQLLEKWENVKFF